MQKGKSKYESLKEFFRPTKGKIIVFILLILIFLFLLVQVSFVSFDCFGSNCPEPKLSPIDIIFFILAFISVSSIMERLFPDFILLILEIAYLYFLSCLIVSLYLKLRGFTKK